MSTQIIVRTDEETKKHAAFRAKSDGISLNKVMHSLLSAYAAGNLKVDISVRGKAPEWMLKSRDEMRKMSQAEFREYATSLSAEQREELWERDDAPYINADTIKSLDTQLQRIKEWTEKTYGPFETAAEMKRSLMEEK